MAKEKTKKTKVPTAKKRILQTKKKKLINRAFKSKVKTAIRCFKESLKNDNFEESQKNLNLVYSLVDKGTKKNIFKKNKSSRIKANLQSLTNIGRQRKEVSPK